MTRPYFPPTCARCGYIRQSKEQRTPICRDCSGALTASERAVWMPRTREMEVTT